MEDKIANEHKTRRRGREASPLRAALVAAAILVVAGLVSSGQAPATGGKTTAADQASEIRNAESIADPAARLRELLRIKSGLAEGAPASARLESDILEARIALARAWAKAGDGAKALAALEEYRAAGGEAGPEYFYARGDACAVLGRFKEAYGLYLSAAIERRPGAEEKAKAAYEMIHGGAEGFEARLDELRSALPFRPAPFAAPKRWRGKTVLAELFTNSENALCLASDLAMSGLARSYPERYLAILEYHVGVPRPDPLSNPAAEARREGYRITSTPTVVVDGGRRLQGGGTRAAAETRFNQYKAYIDGQLVEEPDLKLKAKAGRTGDLIKAAISANRERPGSEHYVALVQARERMKGASGTIVHRLIVRDLVAVDPVRDKTVVFDLNAVERANEEAAASPAENRTRIDRERLRVVYFVQDTGSRRILNAVVAQVTLGGR